MSNIKIFYDAGIGNGVMRARLYLGTEQVAELKMQADYSCCGIVHVHNIRVAGTAGNSFRFVYDFLRSEDNRFKLPACYQLGSVRSSWEYVWQTRYLAIMSDAEHSDDGWHTGYFIEWLRENHPDQVTVTEPQANPNSCNNIYVAALRLIDKKYADGDDPVWGTSAQLVDI